MHGHARKWQEYIARHAVSVVYVACMAWMLMGLLLIDDESFLICGSALGRSSTAAMLSATILLSSVFYVPSRRKLRVFQFRPILAEFPVLSVSPMVILQLHSSMDRSHHYIGTIAASVQTGISKHPASPTVSTMVLARWTWLFWSYKYENCV